MSSPAAIWRPEPPLRFLKVATACRRCGAALLAERTLTLCQRCDDPSEAYREASDVQVAANRLAARRFDHYAAVLAVAESTGWTLYRSERSARSLSLYLEHWRPEAAADPTAYRKTRVSDHDRRPKSRRSGGRADFAADWADLSAEFLFDPTLPAPAAAAALAEVNEEAMALFAWP